MVCIDRKNIKKAFYYSLRETDETTIKLYQIRLPDLKIESVLRPIPALPNSNQ